MNGFRGVITSSARKELEGLERDAQEAVARAMRAICGNPYLLGFRKLRGDDRLRFRVGNYRLLYSVDQQTRIVTFVAIRDRKDAYR